MRVKNERSSTSMKTCDLACALCKSEQSNRENRNMNPDNADVKVN
jgi:hypothetical protein